jgi:ankyrin repeat protein
MSEEAAPPARLVNVLGITAKQGHPMGPGVRFLSTETRNNYLLGLANARQRFGNDETGPGRIHYAVTHNKGKLLRNLKERGADLEMRWHGMTPLMLAISYDKPQMVEQLCMLGADLNVDDGMPLAMAIQSDNFRIANILLNCGANPNIVNQFDAPETPLQMATRDQNERMMKLLLEKGAVSTINAKFPDEEEDGETLTALHMAVRGGCLGCVKLLVQFGADVNETDEEGRTAFQFSEAHYIDLQREIQNPNRWEPPAHYQEELSKQYKILRFLEEYTGQKSTLLTGIIDGGRRRRRNTRRNRRRSSRRARTEKRRG